MLTGQGKNRRKITTASVIGNGRDLFNLAETGIKAG